MSKKKSKAKKIGKCVYCGLTTEITEDHVIPGTLFNWKLPQGQQWIKAPACKSCNSNLKSKDDEYLRDMLVCEFKAIQHPTAKDCFQKMLSSARRNTSVIARDAFKRGQSVNLYTPNGLFLGEHFSYPVNRERIQRIFTRIVKGLFYRNLQKYIPPQYEFQAVYLDSEDINLIFHIFHNTPGCNGPFGMGDGVFNYSFILLEEDVNISYWLIWFYNSVCFSVRVVPPNFDLKAVS